MIDRHKPKDIPFRYVKLSKDKRELESEVMDELPSDVAALSTRNQMHLGWYPVEESKQEIRDPRTQKHEVVSWRLREGSQIVHIKYKAVTKTLDELRQVVKDECNAYRDQILYGGITFMGHEIDNRPETQDRVRNALLATLTNPDYETDWITKDNTRIRLRASEVGLLQEAFMVFDFSVMMHARQLKDQILISDDPLSFDYKTGWPVGVF